MKKTRDAEKDGPSNKEKKKKRTASVDVGCGIVYSDHYNISFMGIEKLHPFDSSKYRRVYEYLIAHRVVAKNQIEQPIGPCSEDYLNMMHSDKYLKSLSSSFNVAMITEVPPVAILPSFVVRRRVLVPMQHAVQGSVQAARRAVVQGWGINLSGGFHHACCHSGGGFCVYADITLISKLMRKEYPERIKRVLIVDLDAHQGNGHERDTIGDDDVYVMDVYNRYIYPGDRDAKAGIDLDLGVKSGISDQEYLELLSDNLPRAFEEGRPDLVIYNAGTDCLTGDPLGCMDVSAQGIVTRDEIVFRECFTRKVPVVMLLSGGYQKNNAPVIGRSILNLDSKFLFIAKDQGVSVIPPTDNDFNSTKGSCSVS